MEEKRSFESAGVRDIDESKTNIPAPKKRRHGEWAEILFLNSEMMQQCGGRKERKPFFVGLLCLSKSHTRREMKDRRLLRS